MSALYRRPRTPYWWWKERYNGETFYRSTKMTNKSLAKKIAQQWDYNLMIGDLSFLDLSSNSNQHLMPYLNDYLKFLSNRMESIKSFKTARGHLNRFADAMSQIRIRRLGEKSVKNIDHLM